jgi:hypothetical protein
MKCTKKQRTGCLAAGAVALGLLLGAPGAASAVDCDQAAPTGGPTSSGYDSGLDFSYAAPGVQVAQTCSKNEFWDTWRRH